MRKRGKEGCKEKVESNGERKDGGQRDKEKNKRWGMKERRRGRRREGRGQARKKERQGIEERRKVSRKWGRTVCIVHKDIHVLFL